MSALKLIPSRQKSIILYGPQGCGKTRNAQAIATYVGMRSWRDNWSPDLKFPKTDHLLITNEPVSARVRRVISFATVISMMKRGEPFTWAAMEADALNIPRAEPAHALPEYLKRDTKLTPTLPTTQPHGAQMKTITIPATLPALGTLLPAQGGYFHGVVLIDGQLYGEVTGRKADTKATGVWHAKYIDVPEARSDHDSLANTVAMAAAGSPIALAAQACRAGGFEDWAVPARGSQLMQWAARDSLPAADAFDKTWHWSSTQFSRDYAFNQNFNGGHTNSSSKAWAGGCARFVRRFPIESLID